MRDLKGRSIAFLLGAALATAGVVFGATITFTNQSVPGSAGVTMFPDGAKEITKSDTDTFERPVACRVGGAGDVVFTPANGATNVTITLVAGEWLPSRTTAILSTGTTATDIVCAY